MPSSHDTYDLCAIGNVCIDIIADVTDEFLTDHNIRKSIDTQIDARQLERILADLDAPLRIPGGAGANVSNVVAALGGQAAFQGKCGADQSGDLFARDMDSKGITAHLPLVTDTSLKSSQILCLNTPDGDRTFASYEGAALTFSPGDLNIDILKNSKVLYLDCYTLKAERSLETLTAASQTTKYAGGIICLNPCDVSVIETYPQIIYPLLRETNSVICNSHEASVLFESTDIAGIVEKLARHYDMGAITDGENGAYVYAKGQAAFIPPADTSRLETIDSNGAGDHFAAGFLFGLLKGYDLEQAGKLGQLCALDCLSHPGARPIGSLKHLLSALTKI